MAGRAPRTSGFLISCNNARIVETALRSLRFVDQLVVIDKSSTDGAAEICQRHADVFVSVPWSPTVEPTRAQALALCEGDLVVFLDDDECLSPEAIAYLRDEAAQPSADIYSLPLRHYILGRHSEAAYYWPQHHVRGFRRGMVEFTPTVHAGMRLLSDAVAQLPAESACCIHHLSHANAAVWVEKTNRYTSQADRRHDYQPGSAQPGSQPGMGLMDYAEARLQFWKARRKPEGGQYEEAVLLLRLMYDLVDATKVWEAQALPDGHQAFQDICRQLQEAYAADRA